MPEVLLFRMLKNIVTSITIILVGIIFGISSHSLVLTAIPLLFGILALYACFKMYLDWKTGKILIILATCIHKEIKFGNKATYIMIVATEEPDKVFNFILNNISDNAFSVSGMYELLFRNNGQRFSEENLIDYGTSDTSIEQLNTITNDTDKSSYES